MLSKITALFLLAVLSTVLQVLVLIYGWGLQPKSWWWIIGVGIFWAPAVRSWMEKVLKEKK